MCNCEDKPCCGCGPDAYQEEQHEQFLADQMDREDHAELDPDVFEEPRESDYEDGMTDVEADADTLRSAGWGTDEDYGDYGGTDDFY